MATLKLNHVTLIHPMSIMLANRRVLFTAFDTDSDHLYPADCQLTHRYQAHLLYGPDPRDVIKMRVTLEVPFANIAGIVPDRATRTKDE